MPLGNLGKRVSQLLVNTVKGAGDIGRTAIEVSRSNVVDALRGVRDVVKETSGLAGDAVAGVIHAASQIGGELGSAAKGAAVGTIRGVDSNGYSYAVPMASERIGWTGRCSPKCAR